MTSLSLVIPSYNEERAIPQVLAEIQNVLLASKGALSLEVIVVDDASTDRSCEILGQYSWVHLVRHRENLGYGAAIKSGVRVAKSDLIAFIDMDATYHVADLVGFAEKLIVEDLDMIVGDRQRDRQSMPPVRRIGNKFFSSLTSVITAYKIKDCASGIRVVRADLLKKLLEELPDNLNFALALTLLMIKQRRQFVELPSVYKKRIGQSKLSVVRDGIRFLICILFYRPFLRARDFQ